MKITIVIVIVVFVLFSCGNIKISTPEGFAKIKSGHTFQAISPEGLPFQVKWFKNYPEKDLSFWAQALRSHLEQEGYRFISTVSLDLGALKMECLEWGAPYGGADYIYLTALMVKNNKILLAEAAGEISLYQKYQQALKKSLETLNIP
ncbi:MAG: hypothetical protein JXR70_14985 [Spirochaetales bacterium]|nr:hypothetical protein [Spirochaetales bacterium]